MFINPAQPSAPFDAKFFPQQVLLLSVGENMMPMGYWTVISKEPFRFLICMQLGNYSLDLLREVGEAALHFMPWSDRERVVRAGYLSGRDVNKADELGFSLRKAEKLQHTKLIEGADSIFETVVHREMMNLSREFVPFIMDVVAVHGDVGPFERQPIIFLSEDRFGTLGEQWEYKR